MFPQRPKHLGHFLRDWENLTSNSRGKPSKGVGGNLLQCGVDPFRIEQVRKMSRAETESSPKYPNIPQKKFSERKN